MPSNHVDDEQLRQARENGANLAELLALFQYFLRATPEGQAVSAELEQDWQKTVARLRDEKRLVGADFSLVEWLEQIRKELLLKPRGSRPAKKLTTPKPTKTKKKVMKFRGID